MSGEHGVGRLSVDVAKISGPYQLLGVFLLVVEGVLLLWLFRAEDPLERIVAGFLMAAIFGAFLFAFIRMPRTDAGLEPAKLPGFEQPVRTGDVDAKPHEVEAPPPTEIAGADGSYVIAKPPDDWLVERASEGEALARDFGIVDTVAKEVFLQGQVLQERPLLSLTSPRVPTITFIPGESLLEGRRFPTALEIQTPFRVRVIPMERAQPPWYFERMFDHNFFLQLCHQMQLGVSALEGLPKLDETLTRRRRITAVLRQTVTDAQVNGVTVPKVDVYITLIGVEGDVMDHLLAMNYLVVDGDIDPQIVEDRKTLEGLVASFKSLGYGDLSAELAERRQQADAKFSDAKRERGEGLFAKELLVLGLRLAGRDMSNPDERTRAMTHIKHFELFARDIEFEDENLAPLWEALHQAEAGDATALKVQVAQLVAAALGRESADQDGDAEPVH